MRIDSYSSGYCTGITPVSLKSRLSRKALCSRKSKKKSDFRNKNKNNHIYPIRPLKNTNICNYI